MRTINGVEITAAVTDMLRRNGWQTDGNNVHGLPGIGLLTAGPGAWGTKYGQSIRWTGSAFVVLQWRVKAREDMPFVLDTFHDVILATADEAELIGWLEVHGERSRGGVPAGSCGVWD